jgi:hypothetical protein
MPVVDEEPALLLEVEAAEPDELDELLVLVGIIAPEVEEEVAVV